MLATRWRRLLAKLNLSLPTLRDFQTYNARMLPNRQPIYARAVGLSDARRRLRRLRRTAHRG
jgi:hypothetical protein